MSVTAASIRGLSPAALEVLDRGDTRIKALNFSFEGARATAQQREATSLEALTLLGLLGLKLYAHPAEGYLVGLSDPKLHDHERWLYYSPNGQDWCHIYNERVSDELRWVGRGMAAELESLRILWADVMVVQYDKSGTITSLDPANLIWRSHFLASHNANWLGSARLPDDSLSLHDLIAHEDLWAQSHPEQAGMPRELVLRMHGFGPCLDSRPEGEGEL